MSDKNKIKIVTDSSADVLEIDSVPFAFAPLKISTDEKEYVDDANLNACTMVEELLSYSGTSRTACPSPADFENAFGDAENVICITITSALSGCYNSALIAKRDYEEKFPDRRVFVLDSLSTGPEMRLIIEKTRELILAELPFEEICKNITEYKNKTSLLFVLESMRNLANNGRVNPIVAKLAGALGIRVIGKASDKGTLETLEKCRGEKKMLEFLLDSIKKLGYAGGKIRISHCLGEDAAQKLKEILINEFNMNDIEVYHSRGLCSFYAEKGGFIIGFEVE